MINFILPYVKRLIIVGLIIPLGVQAETLQQAWDMSLSLDHSLLAIRQNTEVAEQQFMAAKAARLPNVVLSGGYTALDNTPASKVELGGLSTTFPIADRNSLSYSTIAILPIYTSGKISNTIAATDAIVNASRTIEKGKSLDLKLKVAETYLLVLRTSRSVDVINSHVASLKAHERDVQNMYDQGIVSLNDVLASRVSLADAEQRAIQVFNGLDIAKSSYNRLVGRPLDHDVSLEELKPDSYIRSLDTLTEQALSQRSELLSIQEQIHALHYQAASIHAESGPQVVLNGGYAYQENQYQVNEGQWGINIGVQWKIFDGGHVNHRASGNQRQAMALQEQHDELAGIIALQVRQYWLNIQEANKRLIVTEQAIAQAEENLKVNRDRYENGLSTNTEVIDAELLRTRSENNYVNTIYDAVLASLQLKHAVSEL